MTIKDIRQLKEGSILIVNRNCTTILLHDNLYRGDRLEFEGCLQQLPVFTAKRIHGFLKPEWVDFPNTLGKLLFYD